ncbi:MAG: hypothetical protein J0L92_15715 [Deltaproteobacteria bacterium]|nr:hypothetical protein [Deltaproteobacteria bacterium]
MIKKVGLCAALVLAAAFVLAPHSAHAQVRPRGLALGADVALAAGQMTSASGSLGVGGLSLMYWLSDSLMLDFIGRAAFIAPNGGDLVTQLGLGVGIFGVIARGDATALELGGRVSVGARLQSEDQSVAVLGLEVPLRIEHWFDRNFSVNGQVGISVGISPREGEPVPFTMDIGSVTGWAGIGFGYNFEGVEGLNGGLSSYQGPAPAQQQTGYQPPPQQQQGGGDPEQGGAGW